MFCILYYNLVKKPFLEREIGLTGELLVQLVSAFFMAAKPKTLLEIVPWGILHPYWRSTRNCETCRNVFAWRTSFRERQLAEEDLTLMHILISDGSSWIFKLSMLVSGTSSRVHPSMVHPQHISFLASSPVLVYPYRGSNLRTCRSYRS